MKCFRNLQDPRHLCDNNIVEKHFVQWGLSKSEGEIASLLLKGMSLRQIAHYRSTTEATVRQQSIHIYQKANVDGRHQLVAFIIHALFSAASPSS